MSLVRLLTCGKSLVGVQNVPNGYRVTRQRLLPQFGPTRNPFSNKTKSHGGPTQGPSPEDAAGLGGAGAPRAVSTSGGSTAAAMPSGLVDQAAAGKVDKRRLSGIWWSKAVAPFRAMGAKLGGWFGPTQGKAVRSAVPQFSKLPVQGELSLDNVRVVHNDLSDADLEVVPARKPTTRARSAATLRDEAEPSLAEGEWDRATNPVFRAGKA